MKAGGAIALGVGILVVAYLAIRWHQVGGLKGAENQVIGSIRMKGGKPLPADVQHALQQIASHPVPPP
jgi:hypothetical protein